MELEDAASQSTSETEVSTREPPRMSDWLWRHWYARLWWAGIAIYWSGRLLARIVPALEPFYENALAGYLNIMLFPPTLLILLGIGFVGDWMDYYRWEWVSTSDAGLHPRRSIGGYSDPMADPMDPRSPRYWHRPGHGRATP